MAKSIKILLIEDDVNLAQLVSILLSNQFQALVEIKDNGWQALDHAMNNTFDLIILDLMLPGLNGLEICRKIRQSNKTQPILMLTAKTEEQDKIEGFEKGADDYLTKPFSQAELIVRVRALLRRSQVEFQTDQIIAFNVGDLWIDAHKHTLHKTNQHIELTAKEFDLVHFFMRHPGRAFSRQQLLNEVWGPQFDGLEHTVNSTINRLRAKIESDVSKPKYILTAWGVGYRFRDS